MRRILIAVVAVGMVFSSDLAIAQEDAPQMPDKVRGFLDNLAGTWSMDGSDSGKLTLEWNATYSNLSGMGLLRINDMTINLSDLWHWDGVSKDGVILSWSGSIGEGQAYGELKGKVLSHTLMKGQVKGVRAGADFRVDVQIEFKGKDQYTWKRSNLIVDGQPKPVESTGWTRIKPTTRKDFEDFCRFFKGRWIGDVKWVADWPGLGKKGDKVTAYMDNTLAEDGNAIILQFYGGEGSWTELVTYNSHTNTIVSTWATSSGAMGQGKIHRSGNSWIGNGIGCLADGTTTKFNPKHTPLNNDGTYVTTGAVMVGGERVDDLHNVWRRVSK